MAHEDLTPAVRVESILNGDEITPATRLEYFLQKAATELPKVAAADAGKVLTVNSTGNAVEWTANGAYLVVFVASEGANFRVGTGDFNRAKALMESGNGLIAYAYYDYHVDSETGIVSYTGLSQILDIAYDPNNDRIIVPLSTTAGLYWTSSGVTSYSN